METNEKRTADLAREREALETLLATPMAPSELADKGRRLKAIHEEVAQLEDRWLQLQEEIEHLSVT
ncbi:MAG: hypothetical protein GAK30_02154 [Paracidovorax wautersii]|uniref:ABC transporter Uup C-terminal domain-containing protein n=1 Tax=Paracidovorax wautersii TaxID=1177982 RepID=A0A7V8JQ07_9BURK|nr:MAG: hypothetical protein GAK30_02154 [Paracidovorax wautersii]